MSTPAKKSTHAPSEIPQSSIAHYDGAGVHLYISAKIRIDAPAATAFAALTDPSTYPAWNTFVPTADVQRLSTQPNPSALSTLNVGDKMTLHVRMHPGDASLKNAPVEVFALNEPPSRDAAGVYRIAWKAENLGRWMLWAEREMQIEVLEGGACCEFRTWERMGGVLAHVVRAMYGGTLQERFFDWARDLAAFSEGKVAAEKE